MVLETIWFSIVLFSVVSKPAAPESPGNLLEIKMHAYSRSTESEMLGAGLDNPCFNISFR